VVNKLSIPIQIYPAFETGSDQRLPPQNAKDITSIAPSDCVVLDRFWGSVDPCGHKAIQVRLKNAEDISWDLEASKIVGGSSQVCEIEPFDLGCSVSTDSLGGFVVKDHLPQYMYDAVLLKTKNTEVENEGPYLKLKTTCVCDVFVCVNAAQSLPQWMDTKLGTDLGIRARKSRIWERMPEMVEAQRNSQVVKFAVMRKRFFPNSRDGEEIVLDGAGMRLTSSTCNYFVAVSKVAEGAMGVDARVEELKANRMCDGSRLGVAFQNIGWSSKISLHQGAKDTKMWMPQLSGDGCHTPLLVNVTQTLNPSAQASKVITITDATSAPPFKMQNLSSLYSVWFGQAARRAKRKLFCVRERGPPSLGQTQPCRMKSYAVSSAAYRVIQNLMGHGERGSCWAGVSRVQPFLKSRKSEKGSR